MIEDFEQLLFIATSLEVDNIQLLNKRVYYVEIH